MKRFTPNTGTATTYNFAFNNGIHHPHTGHLGAINSSSFTFQSQESYLDDDGDGILTKDEYDVDGDGEADDTDGDGVPDYLDNDEED